MDKDSVRGDAKGLRAVFVGQDMAYGVFYDAPGKRFMLRYCAMTDGKPDSKWRNRSVMLFDPQDEADASSLTSSILADFSDEVGGAENSVAIMQQVKKLRKHKVGGENKTDPAFFFNRLVNVFPELREAVIRERITYGQIRPVSFTKEQVLPRLHPLLQENRNPSSIKKFADICNDLYGNGDIDVRSIITFTILNKLPDNELEVLKPLFNDDLGKGCKAARAFKDRKLKPEKPKKKKTGATFESLDGSKH